MKILINNEFRLIFINLLITASMLFTILIISLVSIKFSQLKTRINIKLSYYFIPLHWKINYLCSVSAIQNYNTIVTMVTVYGPLLTTGNISGNFYVNIIIDTYYTYLFLKNEYFQIVHENDFNL